MGCKVPGSRALYLYSASLGVALFVLPEPAQARFFRARFEPETLELQDPGKLEIDVQMGGLYGDGVDGSRIIIPDLEIDIGLTDWLEIDIDGAFSLTQVAMPSLGVGGDPLWVSARFELLNLEDEEGKNFGIGLQVGPRFQTVDNARGVGLGSLLLVGGGTRTLRSVVNLGVFMDREQATALAYGAGVEWEFERRHKWSLQGLLAGAHYFGNTHGDTDKDQTFLLTGVGRQLSETLELSLLALTGPFAKGDRLGLMAALTWDHQLW
jgi:hypothetical protein